MTETNIKVHETIKEIRQEAHPENESRIIGQYNLTCRIRKKHNKPHSPNQWCSYCLVDQEEAIKKQEVQKQLTTLKGITTSQIRKREKLSDTPAYCFLKEDCATCLSEKRQCFHSFPATDTPVIFRTQESYQQIKAKIKKHSYLQAEGNFSPSEKVIDQVLQSTLINY